jgi:hypothetical protein
MERVGKLALSTPLARNLGMDAEQLRNCPNGKAVIRFRFHGEPIAICEGSLRIIAAR